MVPLCCVGVVVSWRWVSLVCLVCVQEVTSCTTVGRLKALHNGLTAPVKTPPEYKGEDEFDSPITDSIVRFRASAPSTPSCIDDCFHSIVCILALQ